MFTAILILFFWAKVVEAISGLPLDKYVRKEFYEPLGLTTIGFNPLSHYPLNNIAPTTDEKAFRNQLLRGYVNDPGAAMLGGVSGHAGLFSDAYDIAVLMQMLLNGGTYNGKEYLKKQAIDLFTSYHSKKMAEEAMALINLKKTIIKELSHILANPLHH